MVGVSTYSLVHVDGVLAGHHIGDGRAGLLAGLVDGAGHFCDGNEEKKCD